MPGRYAMNTRPDTWPQPDDVDVIQAQERFEESDEFATALTEWMISDDLTRDIAADRFTTTDTYQRAFDRWAS